LESRSGTRRKQQIFATPCLLLELGYPQLPTTIMIGNTVAEGLAADTINAKRSKRYPQLPTTIMIDNTVAEGLAADTINAKRSKSMDVRFFWIRDRIKRGQFCVQHLAGKFNISDFFTKSLPRDKFNQFYAYITVNLDKELPMRQQRQKTETMAKQTL
jgi:hypothetical protein